MLLPSATISNHDGDALLLEYRKLHWTHVSVIHPSLQQTREQRPRPGSITNPVSEYNSSTINMALVIPVEVCDMV